MRTLILIVGLLVAVLLVIFGAQNTQLVNIQFLTLTTGAVSLSLVIMISAIVGAVLAALVGLWDRVRRGLAHRRDTPTSDTGAARVAELEARVAELERENASLRATETTITPEPLRAREVGAPDIDTRLP